LRTSASALATDAPVAGPLVAYVPHIRSAASEKARLFLLTPVSPG
jgi:hypothetical protein